MLVPNWYAIAKSSSEPLGSAMMESRTSDPIAIGLAELAVQTMKLAIQVLRLNVSFLRFPTKRPDDTSEHFKDAL